MTINSDLSTETITGKQHAVPGCYTRKQNFSKSCSHQWHFANMQAAKKFGKLSKLVESQSSGMEQVKKESARHSFRQLVDQCVPYPNNPMQGVERQHIIQCNPHATCVHHMLLNSFFIYMFRPQPFQKKRSFQKKKRNNPVMPCITQHTSGPYTKCSPDLKFRSHRLPIYEIIFHMTFLI